MRNKHQLLRRRRRLSTARDPIRWQWLNHASPTDEIRAQMEYALQQGWSLSVEYTDDPHPRNCYWEMFGTPMFDLRDAAGVMLELAECRKAFPNHYIRMMAFDSTRGVETIAMSFMVNRPASEPGFGVVRQEVNGRTMRYTVHSYATDRPEAQRYTG